MKRVARELERLEPHGFLEGYVVRAGCLSCEADLEAKVLPRGVEHPVRCPKCGKEWAVTVVSDVAAVRLPYGCSGWFDVESSNLAAVGRAGPDLVVRFKKGSVYVYPGAGGEISELLRAESKGRFFATRIRSRTSRLLCARYGCVESPDRAANQVLCERHLGKSDPQSR
jgi:hypothetical protein